jgi:hypothetical protein
MLKNWLQELESIARHAQILKTKGEKIATEKETEFIEERTIKVKKMEEKMENKV